MNKRLLQFAQVLLLGTLVLRALVPVGYMPSALSLGWPVQLCPEGLSPAVMTALLGEAHQHHSPVAAPASMSHHAHMNHHGSPAAELATAPGVEAAPGQCDLAAFSGAVAPPVPVANLWVPPCAVRLTSAVTVLHVRSTAFERYRSRAPPV